MMETTHGFQVIDRETLKAKRDRKEKFHLLNVLTDPEASIPGSTNIPLNKLKAALPGLGLDKNDEIVVYCAGFQCSASKAAAEQLVESGYRKVFAYEGGLEDWRQGNLPLENTRPLSDCGCASESGSCS